MLLEKNDMTPNAPTFIHLEDANTNADYRKWFAEIKQRFQHSQIKAAVRVNTAMLEFYWSLGHDIVCRQAERTYGSGIVEQLSLDLKDAFPNSKGFSTTNIWYAKKWYLFYSRQLTKLQQLVGELAPTKLHQVGGEFNEHKGSQSNKGVEEDMPSYLGLVPWRHHIEIITHCNNVDEALFYLQQTIQGNWSRRRLEDEIAANLYAHQGNALTNFANSLPSPQSQLANEILKDPYHLDFLSLEKGFTERQLEDALIHNITRFLLELGTGFAFIGRQMELRMPNGQSFFPDMIFYHTRLKCYVVVELKVVDFAPEFAGKLNFYVSAADHLLKAEDDNPSIGLLLCRSKDETIVKWSFQDINKPIGVASYQLQEVFDRTLTDNLIDLNAPKKEE